MGRDRLLQGVVAALAGLAGIGVSVYLTFVHFAAVPLVCSTTGAVDCERVLSSGYGVIAGTGIPTSAAGIAWFGVSTALAVGRLTGRGSPIFSRLQLAWSALGLLTVLFLVYVEIVQLGAICIWCSAAHALVLVTLLVAITGGAEASEGSRR